MPKVAPLTKIIFTVLVSLWAMLLSTPAGLGGLVAGQLLLFAAARVPAASYKAFGSLGFFAAALVGMQYALGASLEFSLLIGLRMLAMTGSFILLFAATRIQDLTAALVKQLRVPHEYAFMFTATLRFIPDFFAEIKAVQEAQACRGYSFGGSLTKRLRNYLTIVQPLVLRAITRSETMAMSLELRGFGRGVTGSYGARIGLAGADYLALTGMVIGTAAISLTRFSF
ncbi:MAG: energy-coupling factor transporter transmembrane component T [Negativicutes bacterium]|nr:energy-coupling factor transporter transmembrane component T [Negativicutes bacterium]